MADHLADVRKYVADADEQAVKGLRRFCATAHAEDGEHVAADDEEELLRMRESFLRQRCRLTLSDEELDAAIHAVGTIMKRDRHKLRTTFCYLLAARFDKLDLFAADGFRD